MTDLKWLTPQAIFKYYLDDATTSDGHLLTDVLEEWREQLTFETSIFDITGRKENDLPEFTRHTKPIQTAILEALEGIHNRMIIQAEHLDWVAFGRQHPDAEEEIIPARYWPFLTLDTEKRVANSGEMTFRAVRGLITYQIPKNHPILDKIHDAQKITKPSSITDPEPISDPEPTPQPDVPKTGAPGRPSSMHLIKPEFQRRVNAGAIEESLNKESKALVAWLTTTHPDMPPLTAKTIANNLREEYRTAKQSI